jgi:hypothetical protein
MKNAPVFLFCPSSPVKQQDVIRTIVSATVVLLVLHSTFAQEKSHDELGKELIDPISSLISVLFQQKPTYAR